MNREVLFRGKCVSDSRYAGEWVTGGYVAPEADCKKQNEGLIVSYFGGNSTFTYHVDPDTVGQFTGLVDKNGVKIFEGDIVRWEYIDCDSYTGWRGTVKNVCKVTFEYGSFRINAYPYNLGSCEDFFEDEETYGLEVIGNIYDNRDLLNKK